MIHRTNSTHPFRAKSDAQGGVWVCVGTESGFEATTTLYYDRISLAFSSTVGIDDPQRQPETFALEQNYPNPFNPKTVVSSQLSVASWVRLVVYDMLGREVAVLMDEYKTPGTYRIEFDGAKLASGVYICRMTAGSFAESIKMVLMK